MKIFRLIIYFVAMILVCLFLLQNDSSQATGKIERYRVFTRTVEFDYTSWTFDALFVKIEQSSLNAVQYLPQASQAKIVQDYLDLVQSIQDTQDHIDRIYSDPAVSNPRQIADSLPKKVICAHR